MSESFLVPAPPAQSGRSLERRDVRYEIYAEIGSGGMATVEYARLVGPHGFVRSVAIKRLHPQFAKDPEFVKMFIDEAQLSARLVHANIVATLDVIDGPGELALVMEYVHGESLWNLLRLSNQFGQEVPIRVACAIAASVLHGLHAAHEARNERGELLELVHRDVSPHNILVGDDGIPRLIDFGVAKAAGRLRSTPSGEIKGKLIYMAPEQLSGGVVDRRADVYGAAAVLWETLTGLSLFDGRSESAIVHDVLLGTIEPPGHHRRAVSHALQRIVMRGLKRDAGERFASAREMALALEHEVGIATQSEVADWLQALAGGRLSERKRLLTELLERDAQRALRPSAQVQPPGEPTVELPAVDARLVATSALRRRTLPPVRVRVGMSVALLAALLTAFWLYARGGVVPVANVIQPSPPQRVEPQPPAAALAAPATTASAVVDPEQTLPRGLAPPAEAAPAEALKPPPSAAGAVRKTTHKPASKPECTPYYYVDRRGIRRPKPECL